MREPEPSLNGFTSNAHARFRDGAALGHVRVMVMRVPREVDPEGSDHRWWGTVQFDGSLTHDQTQRLDGTPRITITDYDHPAGSNHLPDLHLLTQFYDPSRKTCLVVED